MPRRIVGFNAWACMVLLRWCLVALARWDSTVALVSETDPTQSPVTNICLGPMPSDIGGVGMTVALRF